MPSAYRVTKIECPFRQLNANDQCYHFGDYTSGGGYNASDTNQLISNLKKKPNVPHYQLKHKNAAINEWARIMRELVPPETATFATFVPMPGSKPRGHADYDPRMERVLREWAKASPATDVRSLLVQMRERQAQHEQGVRLSPEAIEQDLGVDPALLAAMPIRPVVIVVDDVLTNGSSFKAAQRVLMRIPGVQSVGGFFLARTVWMDDVEDF